MIVNRNPDFFLQNESIRIANRNALVWTACPRLAGRQCGGRQSNVYMLIATPASNHFRHSNSDCEALLLVFLYSTASHYEKLRVES